MVINSLEEYVAYILELRKEKLEVDGSNSKRWYYRGQKSDLWPVVPSIYRENHIDIESTLIESAIREEPSEFAGFSPFDILTKLQHYGLATRLLDVTLNPLIALYFACEEHVDYELYNSVNLDKSSDEINGEITTTDLGSEAIEDDYKDHDSHDLYKKIQRNGCVYLKHDFCYKTSDLGIQIAALLPFQEITSNDTLDDLLEKMSDQSSAIKRNKFFLSEDNFKNFIHYLQVNYSVVPHNTNERLIKQAGAFIIPCTINIREHLNELYATKAKIDLRSDFEEDAIIIPYVNKAGIIDDLSVMGINEALLFPELEHKMMFLKRTCQMATDIKTPEFIPFEVNDFIGGDVMSFSESNYENAVLELLDELGFTRLYGPDISRDYSSPLYIDALRERLPHINPKADAQAIEEALRKLTRLDHGTLIQQNKQFTDWLQNGLEVSYQKDGQTRHDLICLVDYDQPGRNSFHAVNQWTVVGNETKRPDLVIFINGLPLVVIELKSCLRAEADISDAYRQIKNYQYEIPALFAYNAFSIISDLVESKVGTITAGADRFVEWKTIDGDYEANRAAQYDVLFKGMLAPKRLLEIVRHFTLFAQDTPEDKKILAGYHQFFAVRKAVESTSRAVERDGKGGVFWHTQGSGKSLSMVFYAGLLQKALGNPTIVVITDRNDLDDQLYGQFCACKDFLRQTPQQAGSRDDLRGLLDGLKVGGIIFTTMQKFEEAAEPLSDRRDIIVMADEAHRGHYGLSEKVGKDGSIRIGAARLIRDSLPRATFIGFTGTPISSKDRNTREVFGDYIDIYDMTQAVEDGATRPVYYESRVMNLGLNEDVLRQIDATYELLAQNADDQDIERSKKELGNMEAILGAPQTIDTLCRDILGHYEDGRQNLLTGKAMIVAYSRSIAMDIYHKMLELRPAWQDKIKVVMTSGNNDPEDWRPIIGNKSYKKDLARKFKDDDDPLKIAIVVDMWLTGFDVPSLATMYVYKPMSGHNLMQAIARVNRVFKDKEGGLVVDYVGIARALKQAMNDYTVRDRGNYGDMNIAKTALPAFMEKLRICGELFHGFAYAAFLIDDVTDKQRADLIRDGINFMLGKDEEKQKLFLREAQLLKDARSLCQSLLNKVQRLEAAYFEAVRAAMIRISSPKKLSFKEINDIINEMLQQSIHSDGVINLFADQSATFSLFDPKFLEEIAKMKEKNLAAELLRKLLAEHISLYKRSNLVQAEKFSERMQRLMNAYRNGQISNAEVIDELQKMAREMAEAQQEGADLGLTPEETAFYDALTKPQAVKDFYTNDQLREMTRELTEELRKNRSIDWQKKESARAGMRMLVKKLLKKYKYPPEGLEDAVKTVIAQCEMWADEG